MKGTIVKAMEKLVIKNFGITKWEECLELSGYEDDHIFMLGEDIKEDKVFELINNISKISGLTTQEIFDAFGEYWINDYAPKLYSHFYNFKTSKEFILEIDKIHDRLTAEIKNAKPPHFEYSWKSDNVLIINYYSNRNLIGLAISLLKGISKYFNENLTITKLNEKQIKVIF